MGKENVLKGKVRVIFGGIDMGYTNKNGCSFMVDFNEVPFRPNQSTMIIMSDKSEIDAKAKATFHELSLTNLRMIYDLKDAPSGGVLDLKFQGDITQRELLLICPGPSKGTRVYQLTAGVISPGSQDINNDDYAGNEVEFRLYGDPTTDSIGRIYDTAGSVTVPAPSSYQYVAADGTTVTSFTDGSTTVPDDLTALQVTFNTSIRPDMLKRSRLIVKTASGNVDVAPSKIEYGTTTGETDFTKVKLSFASSVIQSSTAYDLIIPAGILSFDGAESTAAAAVQFTTTA